MGFSGCFVNDELFNVFVDHFSHISGDLLIRCK